MVSLRRFVKSDIIVFYAPPRCMDHVDWLAPRCELRLVDAPLNDPVFRSQRVYFRNRFWGLPMKLHAYRVQTRNIIHLDCDTIIERNPLELLDLNGGAYDMAVAEWPDPRGKTLMAANCKKLGIPTWPLMMDGCVIFKKGAHLKFKPIYLKYLRMVAMGTVTPHDSLHLGVHALNLALNHFRKLGYNVIRMPAGYHRLVRGSEAATKKGRYVTHLVHKQFAVDLEKKLFSKELHVLKTVGA